MKVYHGTTESSGVSILLHGIDLWKGNNNVDNGRGFYTTPDISFAMRCANWKAALGERRAVIELEIDEQAIESLPRCLSMDKEDIEWAQFIVNNRAGREYMASVKSYIHNCGHPPYYDIVYNRVSDGYVRRIVKELKRKPRLVTDKEVKKLINSDFTYQLSFHTPAAVECIKKIQLAKQGEEELLW